MKGTYPTSGDMGTFQTRLDSFSTMQCRLASFAKLCENMLRMPRCDSFTALIELQFSGFHESLSCAPMIRVVLNLCLSGVFLMKTDTCLRYNKNPGVCLTNC